MHSTKLLWIVLPSLALSSSAQVNNTNRPVRLISLSETLELALNHNLNLKIERLIPEIARYNVELASAGSTTRVGQPGLLNDRSYSYDPLFFAEASKTYVSNPNPLTFSRQESLQNRLLNAQTTQATAQDNLIRANATIRTHAANLASIDNNFRSGSITAQEAQLQRSEEQAKYNNALQNFQQAQSDLANNTARQAYIQELQGFLNTTPVGGEFPNQGVPDPLGGFARYPREVTKDYDFATGLRGALPAGTLYEVRFNNDLQHDTLFDHEYTSGATITVAQHLLKDFLIDDARTTRFLSQKDLAIAEWGLQFAMMQTLTTAQLAYYDLIFAQENVKVQEEAVKLAERFLADTVAKVQAQLLTPLDERQAQSQVFMAQSDLMAARRDLTIRQNNLKNIISDDYAQLQGTIIVTSENLVAVPELYNLRESWSKALQHRPEYNQARLQLEKRNILIKFRKNQLLPQLDLQGSFTQNGFSERSYGRAIDNLDGGSSSYSFGAIFTFPLFNTAAKAEYKLSVAEKERALLKMKTLEQNILNEVENDVRIAQADYSRVEATRQARSFSEAALSAAQTRLENGRATAFEVLQLQKDLTAARFAEINAMAAYNKALAQLYFSEGSTLDRNNIRVNVKRSP